MRQLTSTSLEDTPLISFGERWRKRVETGSLSLDPVSPSSSDRAHAPEIYPSSSHDDIRIDKDDSHHAKSFVSL